MALQKFGTSLALLSVGVAASDWHGVSPDLQQKLRVASSFTCDNGHQRLELLRLNDNYCDCEDGSDEPGTSACSHTAAVFHCVNAGFFSADIPTSRVNDGVCDCCDGSDEYASGASCGSDCYEVMQSFKADKKGLIEQVENGLKDRVALVVTAQQLWEEEEQKKLQLESSITSLRTMLEQLEVKKEQEERVEQDEKERRVTAGKHEILSQLGLLELTKEQLTSIILEIGREGVSAKRELLPIIRKEREAAVDGEEELSKTPMDEQNEAFQERDEARQKETQRIEKLIEQRQKDKKEKALEEKKDLEEEGAAEGGETVAEPDTEAEADDEAEVDDEADIFTEEDLSLPEVETHPIDLLYDALVASERYERSQAVLIRKLLDNAMKKLKEKEKKLTEAQKVMNKDYGVDKLFFGLRDKCVESDAGQYKYKVCFFGMATQDLTKLGDMDDIKGPEESGESSISPEVFAAAGTVVKTIKFSNGEKCWNGPERSLTVKLECGPEPMALYDIEEPSTCVYMAKLRTPAVCSEDDRERMLTLDDGRIAPHHIEIEVPPTL